MEFSFRERSFRSKNYVGMRALSGKITIHDIAQIVDLTQRF
ncbi:MAG: hypothetical protein ABJI96_01770 [Paracoccaceae bacterium]